MTNVSNEVSGYRKLAQSLCELGAEYAKEITTERQRLMYQYFARCCSLAQATVLLVEHDLLPAAYALQKSIVDSMLNGLYIGYVAEDAEIKDLIDKTLKGRGTGYSGMERRARGIDAEFTKRKPFLLSAHYIVKNSREYLNEFGHGGLLSTALEAAANQASVRNRVLADSVLSLFFFVGNVCILEDLDLSAVVVLLKQFDEIRTEGL